MSAVNDRNRASQVDSVAHYNLLSEAEQLIRNGHLKEGAAICQQVLAENEESAVAYYLMGEIYRQLNQQDKALQFNELALRFQPGSDDIYLQRAKLLFALERWDEAEKAAHNAHRLQPGNALHVMLKGDILTQKGDHDGAMAQFDAAVAIQDLAVIREHKGLCQLMLGDVDGAQETFRGLIRFQPTYAPGYVHLAKILIDDDEDEAEKLLHKALMLDPNHCEALGYSSKIAASQHDLPLAIDLARRTHMANPRAMIPNLLAVEPLRAAGLYGEVESIVRALIGYYPKDQQLYMNLAPTLIALNKMDEALNVVEAGLALGSDNAALLHLRASLTGEATDAAPEEYISEVFDNYAAGFDQHLQQSLGYRTPQLIADAVKAVLPAGRQDYSLLDLGCGTGLAAEALAGMTNLRVGVDLSSKMIDQARNKGVYTEVHVDELVRYMQQDARQYDMVVAADVLVYIGKLDALFAQSVKRMAAGGVFALSVEREVTNDATYVLRSSGRYAHSDAYVEQLASQYGLRVATKQVHDLRKEGAAVIEGTLFILQQA